jgi:hypothetical protein
MKKIFVIAISGALLYSCSNSKPKTEAVPGQPVKNLIEITNDMENATAIIPSWINDKTIIVMKEPAAHSDKYACVTNDTIEYGYGYQELVKNINTGIPKSVVFSGWIYTTVATPNLGIILSISENGQTYDWKSFPLNDCLTETGKWVEFSASFYFDKPLKPVHEIKLFPWNQSKKTVYFDDLKIRFDY